MKFTIGSDPEFFIKDGSDTVPICGLLGGTKEVPLLVPGGAVQEDNCAAEINTDPVDNRIDWVAGISNVINIAEGMLPAHKFTRAGSHEFTVAQIKAAGRKAMQMGCDPDYDAWTGQQNPIPRPKKYGFRSAAGHVHVGMEGKVVHGLVKRLDLFLAVPAVLMGDDIARRSLYGKMGAFRPKWYGLEYRVLGNFWCFEDRKVGWVYDQVSKAIHSSLDPSKEEEWMRKAINDGNKEVARSLVSEYNLEVVL